MARARMSETGMVKLPRALRDAVGIMPGGEVEITERDGRLIVEPVPAVALEREAERKLTIEEFLAMLPVYDGLPITDDMLNGPPKLTIEEFRAMVPKYEGPPITDEMINTAVLEEAARRWHEKNSR